MPRPPTETPGTKFPGGHRSRVTPVPIPNTEVKPATADGTARAGGWESRSLPGINHKGSSPKDLSLFLCTHHAYNTRSVSAQKAVLEYLVAERTAALETANTLPAHLAREDGLTGLMNRRRRRPRALPGEGTWPQPHRSASADLTRRLTSPSRPSRPAFASARAGPHPRIPRCPSTD